MAEAVQRGAKRSAKPEIFISHSSRDKEAATHLATILNFCSVDVWLDDWELEVGQSLIDEIARAMEESRYIAILITENYNQTVWTKTEYKKALAREQKEGRTVMLPLIVGKAEMPVFLEDKIYLDMRENYFSSIAQLVGMIKDLSRFRLSRALKERKPKGVSDIWDILYSVGFEPYVVLGRDDFDEVMQHSGELTGSDQGYFYPQQLLNSPKASSHVKSLIRELL